MSNRACVLTCNPDELAGYLPGWLEPMAKPRAVIVEHPLLGEFATTTTRPRGPWPNDVSTRPTAGAWFESLSIVDIGALLEWAGLGDGDVTEAELMNTPALYPPDSVASALVRVPDDLVRWIAKAGALPAWLVSNLSRNSSLREEAGWTEFASAAREAVEAAEGLYVFFEAEGAPLSQRVRMREPT